MGKSRIKKVIGAGLLILGCGGIGAGGYFLGQYELCMREIKPKHTREQLGEIVNSVNTPRDAFEKVKETIKFPHDSDVSDNYPGDYCVRWYSLQESFALKGGVCIDGAIAFVAMLSDNPEYEAKIVSLAPDHAIAVFKENNKRGFVSFNDWRGLQNYSYFYPAEYGSIKELIHEHHDFYAEYVVMDIDPEKLKFGKGIWGSFEELKHFLEWKKINKDKNE